MSYRSPDPADTADNDHDFFATQAMNASPEEEDALYAKYLKMTYGSTSPKRKQLPACPSRT